jgi:hypothetical protein
VRRDYPRDFETVDEARQRLAREDQEEPVLFETDISRVLDRAASNVPPAIPQNHRLMHRLSTEQQDEWSDRMKRRFGGEW